MDTIEAATFQVQRLELLDRLDADGLIVTKHGKPITRVLPYLPAGDELIGSLRHKVKIRGDILTTWKASC